MNTTPFWLFLDKDFAFSLVFYEKWLYSIWIILCCICRLEVSPFCRRTAFFCLEDSVKMSATRESTLGWNDVVVIIWIFQHHLLCSVETYLAEPYSEVRVQALIEKQAQFVLWYTKCTRKRQHIYVAVLIASIRTPLIKLLLYEYSTLLRNRVHTLCGSLPRAFLPIRKRIYPPPMLHTPHSALSIPLPYTGVLLLEYNCCQER